MGPRRRRRRRLALRQRLPEPPKDERHPKGAIKAFKADLDDWKGNLSSHWKGNLGAYRAYRPDLRGTNLQGADLSGLVLSGTDFREARMEGAVLVGARMEGANLGAARMEGAVLREARMEGAVLVGARMDANTSFTAAVLRSAAVKDVTLPKGILSTDQIATMFGDGSVILPDDLEPHRPAHWPAADLVRGDFPDEWRRWQREGDAYRPPERRGDA